MKRKLIEDKTFLTWCELIWDCSEQEFVNYANKRNGTNYKISGANGKSVYYEKNGYIRYFIWINNKKNYETLAHEILHLIRLWLQDCQRIDLCHETEEIYTLLHSFYFRECLKILKNK